MRTPRKRTRPVKPGYVLERQRTSLERLAARTSMTRQQLEASTERDTLDDLNHFIAQTDAVIDHFGSFAELSKQDFANFVAKKKQVSDFWTDLATREHMTHVFVVQAISEVARHLPINWSFISELAHRHGLPVPTRKVERMRAFLEAIPCAYIFDHEFDAFIEWNQVSLVPCVFYNTLLLDSVTEIAQLMSLLFEEHQSFAGLTADDLRSRSRVLIERLIGRRLLVRNPSVIEEPRALLGTLGMTWSAQMFVASHELAHLLLGHDGSIPNERAEHEADMFATLVVGSTKWPNREFGIASVFALIDIIEADRPPSPNHPRPRDRVSVVGMQAAVGKAEIDWNYVCSLLKLVLDDAAESCVGRQIGRASCRERV